MRVRPFFFFFVSNSISWDSFTLWHRRFKTFVETKSLFQRMPQHPSRLWGTRFCADPPIGALSDPECHYMWVVNVEKRISVGILNSLFRPLYALYRLFSVAYFKFNIVSSVYITNFIDLAWFQHTFCSYANLKCVFLKSLVLQKFPSCFSPFIFCHLKLIIRRDFVSKNYKLDNETERHRLVFQKRSYNGKIGDHSN